MADSANNLDHYPKTKFGLIEKVGSKGKYQRMMLIIFCGVWGVTGMALMGTSFFFVDTSFKCQRKGFLTQDCDAAVCSLKNQKEQKAFIEMDDDQIHSIATEFGPYYCDDEVYLNLAQSSTYVGALVGYLLFSFYADNYGRRITFVVAWGIATLGTLMILFSANLVMVGIGLFMLGAGADAAVNMCFNFLGQVVEDETRQKYCVKLQPWFAIGACLVTTTFIWVKNWRIAALILMVIPSCIIMFFVFIYIQETPQFLIRKGIPQTLKALNRIGKINRGLKNILTEQDVINVINCQVQEKKFQKTITPLDLCRFPSLRLVTISLSFVAFAVYGLYYGPVLIIDSIGFDIFVSSYVVQFSELIVYIPLYFYVNYIPRQKAAIILFSIAGICAGLLLFIVKPKDCDMCPQAIFQLVIVAIFRSSSALEFIIMYIYMVELFPARSRAMGGGVASSVGTVASSLSPIILGVFQRKGINQNILFALLALLAVGVSTLMPETLGVPLREEIVEIEQAKNQVRKTGYLVIKDVSEYKSQYKKQSEHEKINEKEPLSNDNV